MAFWYHFAILFEALFILTTIDAGTRVARFMIQDLRRHVPSVVQATRDSWTANIAATAIAVSGWGYFLYQGVVDPLGGINTLWPLFGIANQMLACIALILCTVVLFKMKRERYAWVTIVPAAWLLTCTLTAGWQKIFSENPAIGFLSHAEKFGNSLSSGQDSGAGQVHRRHEPHRLQRLRQCDDVWVADYPRRRDGGLRVGDDHESAGRSEHLGENLQSWRRSDADA